MRTDRAGPGREPGADARQRDGWHGRWRLWLPFVVKPLRNGIVIFVLLLIVE